MVLLYLPTKLGDFVRANVGKYTSTMGCIWDGFSILNQLSEGSQFMEPPYVPVVPFLAFPVDFPFGKMPNIRSVAGINSGDSGGFCGFVRWSETVQC